MSKLKIVENISEYPTRMFLKDELIFATNGIKFFIEAKEITPQIYHLINNAIPNGFKLFMKSNEKWYLRLSNNKDTSFFSGMLVDIETCQVSAV